MGAQTSESQDAVGCRPYPASRGGWRRVRSSELAHALPPLPPSTDPSAAPPAKACGRYPGRESRRLSTIRLPGSTENLQERHEISTLRGAARHYPELVMNGSF